jgi:hypothetical protein
MKTGWIAIKLMRTFRAKLLHGGGIRKEGTAAFIAAFNKMIWHDFPILISFQSINPFSFLKS